MTRSRPTGSIFTADVGGFLEEQSLGVQKDILRAQLEDLDSWGTLVRHRAAATGSLDAAEADGTLPADEARRALQARLREIGARLSHLAAARAGPDSGQPDELPPPRRELAESLRRERARDRAGGGLPSALGGPTEAELHAARRRLGLDAARGALARARGAEAQRRLAMQQACGGDLGAAGRMERALAQLRAAEADPFQERDLVRCGTVDAALALVDAIQERQALLRTLAGALRAREELRGAVLAYEQLVACADEPDDAPAHDALAALGPAQAAWPPSSRTPRGRDREGREAAAPAAWLVLVHDGSSAARLAPGPFERQVGSLAALNAELWGQLAARLEGAATPRALQARLQRPGERRDFSPGPPPLVPAVGSLAAQPRARARAAAPRLSAAAADRYFQAWLTATDERRDLRRATRRDAAARLLGTRSRAIALRQLLRSLPFTSERAIPRDLPRDELVRDTARERTGTFLSATDAGVCKVRFGDHVELLPAGRLVWRRSGPHPFVGGLCLLAWALATRLRGARHLAQLRTRMLTGTGRGARPLARLAAASEDAAVGQRVFFEAWSAVCGAARDARLAVLAEAWAAWRGALLRSRHAAAKVHFEDMSREFGAARLAVARQTRRHEILERKLAEIGSLQGQFWSSWVLQAWQHQASILRAARKVRQEGVRAALWLVREASTGPRLALCFRAWAATRRQERGRRRFLARNMARAQKSTASRHFLEWKVLVRLERQKSAERDLQARDGEFRQREIELSQVRGLLGEGPRLLAAAVGRVERLEASLQAAERAIEQGSRHTQGLERQVARLESESASPAELAEERAQLAQASRERDEARQEEGRLREEAARAQARLDELRELLQQEREQKRLQQRRQEEEARERRKEQATSGPLRRQPRQDL